MSLSPNTGNRVRLRILGIGLQPVKSERAIKAELLIDGKVVHALKNIEKGQPLSWDKLVICDTYTNSQMELAIYEREYRIYTRYGSESCLVSEMMGLSQKLLKINGVCYTAEIKVLDQTQAEESFAKSRKKLEEIGGMSGTPEKLKSTQRMFKSMLELGGAVAELNPVAKTILAVCMRAWERVEEQQKLGEELEDLAGTLIGMAPLVDEVKKHAQLEPLRQNIEDFLYLIEDVSMFVLERSTKGFVVRVLKSVVDSSDRDRVGELAKRLQKIIGEFKGAIGIQSMIMITTAHEMELLQRLNPVVPSGHDPSKACQDKTRVAVLDDIDNWIQDQNPSSRFMWIYGQAGIGKSTILASVCNRLSDRGTPIVSFFCKRDDPSLRDPLRLINSIVHGLACRYPPYGKLVAKAIDNNPELCTSHLRVRLAGLLEKPLCTPNNSPLPPLHILLVDAMDECGTEETRKQFLGCLRDLSSLVPWLRFIVTSRPNGDISGFFDRDYPQAEQRNIQSYSAAKDIEEYIRVNFAEIAIKEDDITRLCAKADNLFIWAATARKFVISDGIDSRRRLKMLIDENGPVPGLEELDRMYSIIIKDSISDQGADNILIMRQCIGAIVATSMKHAVPIEVLCELMREQMDPAALRKIVARLGAVLYSDAQQEGAIRVIHPSFADYALDQRRSGDFWVDLVRQNIELSIIHANITGQLAYSCIYWIEFLLEGDDKEMAEQVTEVIDGPRLLYWLEVLSVLKRVEVAVQGLRKLSQWLKSRPHKLGYYVWDAYRFVFAFSDPIIASAPHIYISALPFSPRQSEVSRRLLPLFQSSACLSEAEDETWLDSLKPIPLPAKLCLMSTSCDSQCFVASCRNNDEPGQILVFDMRTGGQFKTLEPSPSHQPKLVAISPNGNLVASVSNTGEVLLWEANTSATVHKFQVGDSKDKLVEACAFSPDGTALRLLVTTGEIFGTKPTIIETGPRGTVATPLLRLDDTRISAAAFSSDGTCLALGHRDDEFVSVVTSWSNPSEGKDIEFYREDCAPYQIVFSSNGTLIAVALSGSGSPGFLNILDVKKGASIASCDVVIPPSSIAFSPNGTQIIAAYSQLFWEVRIFGLQADRRPPYQSIQGSCLISLVASLSIGDYILCGSEVRPSQISVWEASQVGKNNFRMNRDTPEYDYTEYPEDVLSVLFFPDGTRIVSGSSYRTLRIWDSQTGIPIGKSLHANSSLRFVSISSDGTRILALTDKSTLYAWDAITGGRLFIKPNVHSFALSPDGNCLITGIHDHENDSTMAAWNASTGDIVRNISQAHSNPDFIAFSQTRSHIFSYHQNPILDSSSSVKSDGLTGYRNELCIWDSATYDVVGSWSITLGQYNVEQYWRQPKVHALSPNGDFIVHDAYTGTATTEPLVGHKYDVICIAVSPDGARMASGAGFDPILLWDPRSGVSLGQLSTERIYVYSVAFSPDGTKVVSGLGDSIFYVGRYR